jgi:hypothetical protein
MKIRKTTQALLCFLLLNVPLPGLRAQTEGVGIYTENLKGVFQVDAAVNDPASGDILPVEQADDVVITPEGYVGVGTLTPSTYLHIHIPTPNQAGVFGLRIADGSQNNSKMLASDDEGVASWQTPPTPPSFAVYPIQIVPTQPFPKGSATKAINSAFTVTEDGFYSMDVRFWGEGVHNSGLANPPVWTVTRFQLRRKRGGAETIVDEFQYNDPSYTRVTCFATLYTSAVQGDELSLWIYPVEGFNTLTADPTTGGVYDWIRTKVLYKKMGVNDDTYYFD